MSFQLRRVTGGLAIIIVVAVSAMCADIANLQLVVASPDPVQAGTDVNFQVILVNAGSEMWDAKTYSVEAELYDLSKTYLHKSDRIQGERAVNPGGKSLIYVQLSIPEYFSGIYYYRIYIMRGTTRVYTGKLTPLRVNPLPILPPKPPAVKLGGNSIFSYRSDSSNDWNDYTGNVSVNLVGRVLGRSILFNLYTIHDQDDAIDIYTILFNYYGGNVRIALGDILPEFSELSMYGTGMRGVSWENQAGNFKTTLIGARLIESAEGTSTTDGVYRRMLYGGEEEISLPWKITGKLHMLGGSDVESSVDIAGPTLVPEKDTVYGGALVWNGFSFLTIKGQYASSSWVENTLSTAAALSDSAYRSDIEIETDYWTMSSYYQRTGPDFKSFGAPEANADRITLNMTNDVYLFDFWTLSAGYNKFFDDLDDDPNIVRTTQEITNGGTSLNFRTGTGISGSYSLNAVFGELRDIQDNETKTMTYGLSQSVWGQSIAVNTQTSEFRDKVNPDSDLDTMTNSFNINCVIGSKFSGSLGVSLSENKDIFDSSEESNNSYSLSINQIIMRDTLTMQLWGTNTLKSDTDKTEDSVEVEGNIEFTYVWKKNVSVTLGGSSKSFNDEIDPSVNTHETGANMRVNYSF
ncbi:MAG: hypothetical protein ABII23_00745 [bacterium]